jgi:hypothetical protein
MSSASAGGDGEPPRASELREPSAAAIRNNEIDYREALSVYATVGGTAGTRGAHCRL